MADEKNGATVLCEALKEQGVEYIFGIVGVPVIEVGIIAQATGIKYVGCRNEQAASYAASAMGYLTGRPAACLTVPGPGLLHVIPGMVNANENCWPLIVISGCMEDSQEATGSFQELNQVAAAKPYAKFAARPSSISRIPFYVEKAVRTSIYGRPGSCYIDLPANLINGKCSENEIGNVARCPDPPKVLADPQGIREAVDLIFTEAKRPLVIIGKGAAYGRAEMNLRKFVLDQKLPFLPTPMGKGVLPDDHPQCVAPARSRALLKADVIFLVGARLNWMLHFGKAPRFDPNVKIIQVDICPEEMHNNIPTTVPLHGDINSVIGQMNDELQRLPGSFEFNPKSPWWKALREKIAANHDNTQRQIDEDSPPMNYYNAFHEHFSYAHIPHSCNRQIETQLPRDTLIVAEGSNTMDISRTVFLNSLPRHRLDAGTYGTMGVGVGFALAAALWCRDYAPEQRVVCIEGDSAFGFSGMEVETICRYNLPVILIVINNNGITMGIDDEYYQATKEGDQTLSIPPTGLSPGARYEQMMEAFGGKGYLADTREELRAQVKACLLNRDRAALINCRISPSAGKKSQDFFWLTSKV